MLALVLVVPGKAAENESFKGYPASKLAHFSVHRKPIQYYHLLTSST